MIWQSMVAGEQRKFGLNDEDEADLPVPAYLVYPPTGWPDALPARRAQAGKRRFRFWR